MAELTAAMAETPAALLRKILVGVVEENPATLATASRLFTEARGTAQAVNKHMNLLKLSTIERQFASFKKEFKRELRAFWDDGEHAPLFNEFVGDTVLPVIDARKVLVQEQNCEHLLAHTALSWLERNLEGFPLGRVPEVRVMRAPKRRLRKRYMSVKLHLCQ
jgi:hypothetical protein